MSGGEGLACFPPPAATGADARKACRGKSCGPREPSLVEAAKSWVGGCFCGSPPWISAVC